MKININCSPVAKKTTLMLEELFLSSVKNPTGLILGQNDFMTDVEEFCTKIKKPVLAAGIRENEPSRIYSVRDKRDEEPMKSQVLHVCVWFNDSLDTNTEYCCSRWTAVKLYRVVSKTTFTWWPIKHANGLTFWTCMTLDPRTVQCKLLAMNQVRLIYKTN